LGADDVVPYFDTGLDPVRVVVAAPEKLLVDGQLPKRHMRLATEYVALAEKWVKAHGVDAEIYKTFGSTEVFPPDDAEIIVDNTATGTTLRANQLAIVDEITKSSTFLCINRTVRYCHLPPLLLMTWLTTHTHTHTTGAGGPA
jgi:ATP phosphoribosyltransferase